MDPNPHIPHNAHALKTDGGADVGGLNMGEKAKSRKWHKVCAGCQGTWKPEIQSPGSVRPSIFPTEN